MKLDLSSGSLGYLDQGNGPAVLLVHAFPLNKRMWTPQIDVLSKRFRVIAPDIPGFGESQPASAWTMEDMADRLEELLGHLGIAEVAIAGVSIGGYIALAFWSKYPNRLRKLVLSNSRARGDTDAEKNARNDMIQTLHQKGAGILAERMLPRLLQPNPSPDAVRTVRGMIEQADATAAAYALMAMRDRRDFSGMLNRIECATLIITGENDAIIPSADARRVAESIPEAEFAVVANSGHLSNLENPEAFNSVLLNFLAR